jgi:hypothetical protein
MLNFSRIISGHSLPDTIPVSADQAIGHMNDMGLSPAALKNLKQVGWVNKSHPELFRSMTQLTVCNLSGGVAYTQNSEWQPVFVVKGVGD